MPGAYLTGTPYADNEDSTNIIPSCALQINIHSETPTPENLRLAQDRHTTWPQARHSGQSPHQGSLGISTIHSVSSMSLFDWDNDGELVLLESVIAAAERESM